MDTHKTRVILTITDDDNAEDGLDVAVASTLKTDQTVDLLWSVVRRFRAERGARRIKKLVEQTKEDLEIKA